MLVPVRESEFQERLTTVQLAASAEASRTYRKCANYADYEVCNWMVAADSPEEHCRSCRLNEVIPNLDREGNLGKWYRIEQSKRRLAYGLTRLGLKARTKTDDPENGLAFGFLSSLDAPADRPVLTGHADRYGPKRSDVVDPGDAAVVDTHESLKRQSAGSARCAAIFSWAKSHRPQLRQALPP